MAEHPNSGSRLPCKRPIMWSCAHSLDWIVSARARTSTGFSSWQSDAGNNEKDIRLNMALIIDQSKSVFQDSNLRLMHFSTTLTWFFKLSMMIKFGMQVSAQICWDREWDEGVCLTWDDCIKYSVPPGWPMTDISGKCPVSNVFFGR